MRHAKKRRKRREWQRRQIKSLTDEIMSWAVLAMLVLGDVADDGCDEDYYFMAVFWGA